MPSTSPPIGPDTPPGAPLRDEEALERLFRSHYAALAEEAKTHLKDAASAAPRIVETLFLRAWDERTRFKTVEELDAFFKQEIAHASARELARRASAHHFSAHGAHAAGHAEPAVDVDQSWERVHRTLHPDREAATGAVAAATRHDAASHVKGLAKRRNYTIPIVIILAAIALAFGISHYLNRIGREGGIVDALKAAEPNAHQSRDAQFANVDLNDSSTVKMGPDTKVVVVDNYGDNMRVVGIEGNAAVTVTPGHKVPLQIRSYGIVIDAPAGTVILQSSPVDSSVTVIAKDGNDSLRIGQTWRPLGAGQAIHITKDGQVSDATPAQFAEAASWVSDTVSVINGTLQDAVEALKTWYGTKVIVLDSALLTRPVTIQAPLDNSMDAISAIEKSADVKFGYEGQAMVFRPATGRKR